MSKDLIIFYSSTNYNRKVAEIVAVKTSADLFEVKPVKAYDTNMWVAWDVAKREREENNLPKLATDYPDMSKYDRIFFGGPSWGFTISNPLQTFLQTADFASKRVYPWVTFYDHDENYLSDLKKQDKNAEVQPLLELTMGVLNNRADLGETIENWLKKIGE
ncbi:MAG: flavodoxin [Lactobacillus sp.]|nr:flavodoxin [Lactobacillus sp.]